MTVRSKAYFEALLLNGYIPDQNDFADLVESYQNVGGSGVIMQTAFTTSNANITTTSTSMVDSGITVTLPNNLQSVTSSVRLRACINFTNSNVSNVNFTMYRGAVDLTPGGSNEMVTVSIPGANYGQSATVEWVDTPGTTTPATYHIYWSVSAGTGAISYTQGGYVGNTTFIAEELVTTVGGSTGVAYRPATLTYQQPNGTVGGTASSGGALYPLNTIQSDPDGIIGAFSGSLFTPIAGSYQIAAAADLYTVAASLIVLYNATTSTIIINGIDSYSNTATEMHCALLNGGFTANGTDQYQITYYVQNTAATYGLGAPEQNALSLSGPEIYGTVTLTPVGRSSSGSVLPPLSASIIDPALQTPIVGSGSYTVGRRFTTLGSLSCIGVQVYWAGAATTLDITLWNGSGSSIATGTIVTTGVGLFKGLFSAVTTLAAGQIYTASYVDTAGSPQFCYVNPSAMVQYVYSPPGIAHIAFFYAGGNAFPNTSPGGNSYLVDPLFA